MKERGKRAVESSSSSHRNDDGFSDFYYSSSSDLPCKKHPSISSGGICPYCLNDRLVSLVCSECGEQRLSSCSCSDFSPNRSSNAAVEVGSVGRISLLIENEKNNYSEAPKQTFRNNSTAKKSDKEQKADEVVLFKRSSSSCVEIKRKNNGFWRIGRFFRKASSKKERDYGVKSVYGDEKSDSWVLDYNDKKMGVSRSRSLCSFRGNGFFVGSEDGSSYSRSSISAARSSSVNGGLGFCETEPRRSFFEGRKSGFSETEHRKSGFSETEPRRSWFEGRKSNFSETEHRKSNFSETEQRRACFEARKSNFSETEHRKSGFSETEHKRAYFEGRKSNFSETELTKSGFGETEPRKSCFEGRKSNFSETEHRRSNFSETEHRRSCYEGRRNNFGETEPRRSDLNRRVFSLKESYFTGGEEPGFIDLKFDFSTSEQRHDYPYFASMRSSGNHSFLQKDGVLDHGGGSCRITVSEKGMKKSRKSFKGWKWIFGHQPARKKDDEDTMVN